MDYSNKTREELILICKENNIKGYSGKKKEDKNKKWKIGDRVNEGQKNKPGDAQHIIQISKKWKIKKRM